MKLERILCGTGDEDTMRQNWNFPMIVASIIGCDWLTFKFTYFVFFGFRQEFPFSPFIVMALWMGIVIEIYVYVYIIYMTKITDRIVDLGAEWLALLSVCFIGIWVHRFSTEAYIFFISMSHICFTFNRENLVIRLARLSRMLSRYYRQSSLSIFNGG